LEVSELRPLSLGELLDRTFSYFRRHFGLFVAIMAVPQVIILFFTIALEEIQRSFLQQTGVPRPATSPGLGHIGAMIGGLVVIMAVYFIVYGVALGATTFAVSDIYLGRATSARAAYRRVRNRFWSLMGLIAAVTALVFLVVLLLLFMVVILVGMTGTLARILGGPVQGILMVVVLIVAYLAANVFAIRFALRYGCTVPALLLENLKVSAAIKRSVRLTKKQLGRIFLIGVLMALVSWMVALLLEGPFIFAQAYMAMKHHMHPPFWLTISGGVMGAVGHAITGPLLMIGLVLLYYDIRVRKEGFDLQVMMSALDAQSTGPAGAPGFPPAPGQESAQGWAGRATPLGEPSPPALQLESRSVVLVVGLTLVTLGLYYPVWFMLRRSGINSLHSKEKLGAMVFALVIALQLLVLGLILGQGYLTSPELAWLRFFDSAASLLTGILLLVQTFKVKRILEDHAAESSQGLFGGSISLAQESSLSGVATFFFGIFYLQHKINGMVEAWTEGHPDVGPAAFPVV
jgi:membrane-anchored glycerophosphoryl diester phosphodiesterase (GDPDase)